MKLSIKAGSTSQTIEIFIRDSSSSTGGGLTGLAYNSAGLTCYYSLPRAAPVAVTLATLAAVTSAFSSGGFKEIDATNTPGLYRFDIPDAALASGRFVVIYFKGATNMAPTPLEIELTATDNQDAAAFGLSRLDAAITTRMATFTLPTNFSAFSIDASGRIDLGKWIGSAPAALTASGYLQSVVLRWLTDNAGGTPNALQSGRVDSYIGAASASVETEFANAMLDKARAGNNAAGTFGEAFNKIMSGLTGVSLASTGLDSISITDVSNDADARSSFPKMIRAIFNRFYDKVTQTSTQQKVYNDSATLISTMAVSDDGTTQTKDKSA